MKQNPLNATYDETAANSRALEPIGTSYAARLTSGYTTRGSFLIEGKYALKTGALSKEFAGIICLSNIFSSPWIPAKTHSLWNDNETPLPTSALQCPKGPSCSLPAHCTGVSPPPESIHACACSFTHRQTNIFGTVLIGAMARGLPVLACSSRGEHRPIATAEQTGWWKDPAGQSGDV